MPSIKNSRVFRCIVYAATSHILLIWESEQLNVPRFSTGRCSYNIDTESRLTPLSDSTCTKRNAFDKGMTESIFVLLFSSSRSNVSQDAMDHASSFDSP